MSKSWRVIWEKIRNSIIIHFQFGDSIDFRANSIMRGSDGMIFQKYRIELSADFAKVGKTPIERKLK